jgi:hypothetical protein
MVAVGPSNSALHQTVSAVQRIAISPNAFAQYNSMTDRLDFNVRLRYAFAEATDLARDGREAGGGRRATESGEGDTRRLARRNQVGSMRRENRQTRLDAFAGALTDVTLHCSLRAVSGALRQVLE